MWQAMAAWFPKISFSTTAAPVPRRTKLRLVIDDVFMRNLLFRRRSLQIVRVLCKIQSAFIFLAFPPIAGRGEQIALNR
jgi:hypothetical protein